MKIVRYYVHATDNPDLVWTEASTWSYRSKPKHFADKKDAETVVASLSGATVGKIDFSPHYVIEQGVKQ